jgi:tRNA(Ile)-lysidine synthase
MKNPSDIPWLESASKRARWLVGVSGGADSVALLHLLTHKGFRNLVVCHLDHQLRGRASTGDARFVKALAEKLGHACEIRAVDVAKLAGGESVETAARHARHAFFADCARKWKSRRLVLAHHADDQAETVLWNLLRGSHGIKGMEVVKKMQMGRMEIEIHRPLLHLRREVLVSWLRENRLKWREDATNAEPFAIRNRLRNEAIPLLDAISGRDAVASLALLAADAIEAREILAWAVRHANALDPAGRIHVPVLRALPLALRRAVVAKFLADHGIEISRDVVARCLTLADADGPRATNLPGGRVMRRRAGRMWIDG